MAEQPASVASIARSLGVSARKVAYAISSRGIKECGWVGPTRVYDPEAVKKILAAIAETSSRPCPGRTRNKPDPSHAEAVGR
jgi:hypothetical protein